MTLLRETLVVTCVTLLVGSVCCSADKRRDATNQDFEFVEDTTEKGTSTVSSRGRPDWILDPNNELCNLLRCGSQEVCLLQDRFTAVCVNREEAARYGDGNVVTKDGSNDVRNPGDRGADDVENDDDDDYYDDDDDDEEEEDYLVEDSDEVEANVTPAPGDVKDDVTKDKNVPRLNRRPFARKQCATCPVVRPSFLCGSDNKTYSSVCRLQYHNCLHDGAVKVMCKGFCPCKDPAPHALRKEQHRQRMNSYLAKLRLTAKEQGFTTLPPRKNTPKGSERTSRNPKYAKYTFSGKLKPAYARSSSKYPKEAFRNKEKYYGRRRQWPDPRKNEVTLKNTVWGTEECSEEAQEAMGNRLLDWFSVVMSEASTQTQKTSPGPSWCKKEVSWMLDHLDTDGDQRLNIKELYRLEHDDHERCIRPFIDRCDLDRDLYLSSREWCKCFDKSDRPCAALRKTSKGLLGGYIPECDSEGYYLPTQCHVSAAICWCVDKHGVELPGSRSRGAPNCEVLMQSQSQPTSNHIDDDTEADPDDADVTEGSADLPLDI